MTERRPSIAAALVLLSTIMSGCGSTPDGNGASRPPTTFLSIGTAPPGGAFFVVGGALAEVLAKARAGDGWQVTAEATKGSQENIRRLVSGELDLALSNSAITYFARRGEGVDRSYDVASVMTLAPNVALFVTPKNSGIRTLADLRGHRVVLGPAGAGFELFVGPILEAHGISLDELETIFATQSGAVDLLADGAADAAFLGGAVPTASVTQAAAGQELWFIPYDEAAIESLLQSYPFFGRATIPAQTYRGLEEDFHGLDVGSMHLIAGRQADEERVYLATRTLWEQRAKVVERHPAGRAINERNVARFVGTPFHPGAERFFREIGVWPTAADETPTTGAAAASGPAEAGSTGDR